jgi:F0F1-type ATP synthase assembly protein I
LYGFAKQIPDLKMSKTIALKQWKKDVVRSLIFQLVLLFLVCCACAVFGWNVAVNATIAGLAVVIPNVALGAWMGVRLLLGEVSPYGMLIGGALKTLLSVVLIGAAFAALQEFGWVWQGFFAGLLSTVFAPVLFGISTGQRS